MKFTVIALVSIVITLSGCAERIIKTSSCIPPVNYISTKSATFISYQLVDQSKWRSFDALQVSKEGEWLMEIVGDDEQALIDIAGEAVESERHPPGTVVKLTGKALTLKKHGVRIGPSGDLIYLKGRIGKKIIWIAPSYFNRLNKNGNPENIASNQLLGLEELNVGWSWSCINK